MLEALKESVCKANLLLPAMGLVAFTWGNVSAIDRQSGMIVIKPSGVDYSDLKPEMMVVVSLEGEVVEGDLRPSSDTPTHLELYKSFPAIGGVTHTHSTYATAFAQAQLPIIPFGTTHADSFYGAVPCTRALTAEETETNYERNTGKVIAETFAANDPVAVPAVLVANHGVFTWGNDAEKSVENAAVAEEVAKMAILTITLNPEAPALPQYTADKHYFRKHGKNAYYGQK